MNASDAAQLVDTAHANMAGFKEAYESTEVRIYAAASAGETEIVLSDTDLGKELYGAVKRKLCRNGFRYSTGSGSNYCYIQW